MAQIKMLTGVVEVGLFCKMARAAYFGNSVSESIRGLDSDIRCANFYPARMER